MGCCGLWLWNLAVGGGLNCILATQPRTFIYRRVPRRFFFIRYVFRIRSLRNCFSATARAPFPTKHPQHSPPRPLPALALPRGAPGGRARLVIDLRAVRVGEVCSRNVVDVYIGLKNVEIIDVLTGIRHTSLRESNLLGVVIWNF